MTLIEYVSVLVSIVLGLAIAELGTSFHRLMRARARVRWDWMSLALAFVTLLEIVQFWWLTHDLYEHETELRLVEFLPSLLLFFLIYLMAAAVLPDEVPTKGLDLRKFYSDTAPYFWSLILIMTIAIIVIRGPVTAGSFNWFAVARSQWVNFLIVVAVTPLLFVRNIRLHQTVTIAFVAAVSWIYLTGARALH